MLDFDRVYSGLVNIRDGVQLAPVTPISEHLLGTIESVAAILAEVEEIARRVGDLERAARH